MADDWHHFKNKKKVYHVLFAVFFLSLMTDGVFKSDEFRVFFCRASTKDYCIRCRFFFFFLLSRTLNSLLEDLLKSR